MGSKRAKFFDWTVSGMLESTYSSLEGIAVDGQSNCTVFQSLLESSVS